MGKRALIGLYVTPLLVIGCESMWAGFELGLFYARWSGGAAPRGQKENQLRLNCPLILNFKHRLLRTEGKIISVAVRMEQQHRGVCGFSPDRSAGCADEVSTGQPSMRLSVITTTGCPVELSVPRGETVEGLRSRISQNLRLQTSRIVLLHKDR